MTERRYDITGITLTEVEILDRNRDGVTVRLTMEGTIHPESADLLEIVMTKDKGNVLLQGRLDSVMG